MQTTTTRQTKSFINYFEEKEEKQQKQNKIIITIEDVINKSCSQFFKLFNLTIVLP